MRSLEIKVIKLFKQDISRSERYWNLTLIYLEIPQLDVVPIVLGLPMQETENTRKYYLQLTAFPLCNLSIPIYDIHTSANASISTLNFPSVTKLRKT